VRFTVVLALGAPATLDPATRTMIAGPFVVRWSLEDPEAIVRLSWNGSPNLTNSWVHPGCPEGGLHEFFGNSWGGNDETDFGAAVGWGSIGTWSQHGITGIDITSATTACGGTSGIKVRTSYGFGNAGDGRIQIERQFDFGSTSFAAAARTSPARIERRYTRIPHPT
jgi:hypothetical protein